MNLLGKEPVCKGAYDVVVVGGGIAGVAAAVSASREGAKTLLIEKGVNLGGLATMGLISWYEPLCDGKGRQMIYGIAQELLELAISRSFDNLPVCWGGSGQCRTLNTRFSTNFSPTVFSALLDSYVMENGVTLRFDSLATYPVMEENICRGVVVESVEGREYFEAGAVIDATGTASVMHAAGVPTVTGENYMTYVVHGFDKKRLEEYGGNPNFCKIRKWIWAGSDLFGNGQPEGLGKLTGVTAEDVTDYVVAGKKMILEKLKDQDKYSYDIMALPDMPQFRTIRRMIGDRDFEAIDKKTYEDSIGDCGDFRPNGAGKHYQIPAGALKNSRFPNLYGAGRIISAPAGDGWEVARVIPVCALTGEAAGKMAAGKMAAGKME